jgi:hypothetical protein
MKQMTMFEDTRKDYGHEERKKEKCGEWCQMTDDALQYFFLNSTRVELINM